MARRNKLLKFTELLTFPNVFENFEPKSGQLVSQLGLNVNMQNEWKQMFFKNDHPITVEMACGRGEYSLALAERYPERNFIGVDIKGARIWKGAKIAIDRGLKNVAFLRAKIEFCPNFFGTDEVDEIWITFPDPFLKTSKFNRRLTSPNYLNSYKQYLKPDGIIHLKTDSDELYEHSVEIIKSEKHKILVDKDNIYSEDQLPHQDLDIKTFYEHQHLKNEKTIKYLQFRLNYLSEKEQE